ncbi:PREDICTED: putative E3 ubiquitin-protein ligase LIN-1 [Ipomoea nil]|uniref:putative E3 ubiquitin-protein ligase LIN-1 n=1 Tax=Ipomoea nil TaxID=35883 RepID=UPI000901AC14|nr:PREDICTED: putative E3 ubiquitin-protein ligase LIN-1 [Ipomoea nil]
MARQLQVWSISNEGIRCEQAHEIKDHVNNLVVSESLSCFIPQGTGIKVHSWGGEFKLLNQAKHARCLALAKSKLYCGCRDNSIQEIDMNAGTVFSIQSGSRKLLVKASPVNALQLHDGLLYSAGSSLDGTSVKIWDTWNHSMIASLPSTMDVQVTEEEEGGYEEAAEEGEWGYEEEECDQEETQELSMELEYLELRR